MKATDEKIRPDPDPKWIRKSVLKISGSVRKCRVPDSQHWLAGPAIEFSMSAVCIGQQSLVYSSVLLRAVCDALGGFDEAAAE